MVRIGKRFVDWLGTADGEKFYQTIYDIWQTIKWIVKELVEFRWLIKDIIAIWLFWKGIKLFDGAIKGITEFSRLIRDKGILTALENIGIGVNAVTLKFLGIVALAYGLFDIIRQINGLVMGKNSVESIQAKSAWESASRAERFYKESVQKSMYSRPAGDYPNEEMAGYDKRLKELHQATLDAEKEYKIRQVGSLESFSFKGIITKLGDDLKGLGRTFGLDFKPLYKMIDENKGGAGADFWGKGDGTDSDAAMNMSNLSGANGGLGQAKVLNLYFNKALIENNIPGGNGKDIMNVSQQAAELVIRICNNIASPQGAIM